MTVRGVEIMQLELWKSDSDPWLDKIVDSCEKVFYSSEKVADSMDNVS